MTRKNALGIAIGVSAAIVLGIGISISAQKPAAVTVDVYKSPTCGCCGNWVKHLQDAGFTTRVTEQEDLSDIKKKHGVPSSAISCHTAIVDGYVIEGHVPAADVRRLLKERPAIAGLAVPGMPVGSPGMEYGNTVQPYNVMAVGKNGQLQVFSSYGK